MGFSFNVLVQLLVKKEDVLLRETLLKLLLRKYPKRKYSPWFQALLPKSSSMGEACQC